MARQLIQQSPECDPASSLMSEAAVCRYLGTDGKGILALIRQQKLKRDELTGAFAREQVQRVHDEIVASLVGRQPAPASGYRAEPILS